MLPQPHFRTKLILLPTWLKIGLVAIPIGFIIGISVWAFTAVNSKLDKINDGDKIQAKPEVSSDQHTMLMQVVSEKP
jgi:hypothetical protein